MIKKDRLAETFLELVQMDSPSRSEGRVARYLTEKFKCMGAEVLEDKAGSVIGGESGNLIVRLPGTRKELAPIMFNAHMDTVEPGKGIKVIFENGTFRSDGQTVLGGDDKSGIAVLIEAASVLKENNLDHGPLEYLFTVAEEIGLCGAKNLDYGLLKARMGYALDTSSMDKVITGAPEGNTLLIKVRGLAAHAGLEPEKGINAFKVAAQALAEMELGRIDPETTANIGVIKGGTARNIVPDYVEMEGEVRSHDKSRLAAHTEYIRACLEKAIVDYKQEKGLEGDLPLLEMDIRLDYPLMNIADSVPVVQLVQRAARNLGRPMESQRSGGGSDANIFNSYGISTVILGTGMQRVHTTEEFIALEDMVQTTELILKMIQIHR